MLDKGAEETIGVREAPRGPARGGGERGQVGGRVVRERIAFRVTPEEFDRIEFRGIRREQLHADVPLRPEPALHRFAAMRVAPVPDQRDRRAHDAPQLAEEGQHPRAVDARVGRQAEEAADAIPRWRNDERGDRGDLLARTPPLPEHRRLAARRPRAPGERGDQVARFVEEDERGPAARGVFFTRAQCAVAHAVIAASSRSIARRAGCCGLQPKACRTRPR